MKTVHKPSPAKQGPETEATETPERLLMREVLEALDLPRGAGYNEMQPRADLLQSRVAFICGYLQSALERDDVAPFVPGLARAAEECFPVTYQVAEGGES